MSSDPSPPERPEPRRRPLSNPIGMGAPIALIIIAGVVIGGLLGQPSIGLLTGVALGVILAIVNRRK